jgi:hypothetical protein
MTVRRYRTIQIQAGDHTITVADPLPSDTHTALEAIRARPRGTKLSQLGAAPRVATAEGRVPPRGRTAARPVGTRDRRVARNRSLTTNRQVAGLLPNCHRNAMPTTSLNNEKDTDH